MKWQGGIPRLLPKGILARSAVWCIRSDMLVYIKGISWQCTTWVDGISPSHLKQDRLSIKRTQVLSIMLHSAIIHACNVLFPCRHPGQGNRFLTNVHPASTSRSLLCTPASSSCHAKTSMLLCSGSRLRIICCARPIIPVPHWKLPASCSVRLTPCCRL